MAQFKFPIASAASQTAPTDVLPLTVPSAEAERFHDGMPLDVVELPSIYGWACANGVDPIRIVTRGSVLDCGLLAPSAAPTGAAGVRATNLFTITVIPSNGETITITHPTLGAKVLKFVTALSGAPLGFDEVLIGANLAASVTNLVALVNGTAGEGATYAYSLSANPTLSREWSAHDIEISASDTATATATFRVISYGTAGNAFTTAVTCANGSFAATAFAGGTNATTGDPGPGTRRYFHTSYRDKDGAESGPSEKLTFTSTADANVAISGMTANADTTSDYTRLYRTANIGTEFRLIKTIASSGTTVTDNVSDDDSIFDGNDPYDEGNFRSYAEGFPPKVRCLALWKGRLWGGGAFLAAQQTRGTASVTLASASVTLSSTFLSQKLVGRIFQVASTSEKYEILTVNVTTNVLTLNRAYVGSTNASASYTIRDERDPSQVYCSVVGLFNQWPTENNPGGVDSDDAEGVTGFCAMRDSLLVFSRTSVSQITGEDIESWQMHKIVDGVGAAAPRLIVPIEGGCLFLGNDGIYAMGPDGSPQSLSSPLTQKRAQAVGIGATINRIEWANIAQGFAWLDAETRRVHFAVPMDGDVVPNHEIVLDLQNKTWVLYKRAGLTCAAPVSLPSGGQAVIVGNTIGCLFQDNEGTSDGAYGFAPVQTLTGGQTKRVLTTNGTALPTTGSGLKGVPVLVIYQDGSTVARGMVASNTNAAVTLVEDLATAPAASDQIVLGGINWKAQTGYYSEDEDFERKQWRDTVVSFVPVSAGEFHYAYAIEGGSFTIPTRGYDVGDATAASGRRLFKNQTRAMSKADMIQGFQPGPAQTIRGVTLSVGVREGSSA